MSLFSRKKSPVTESQLEAAGRVSIWIGDFENEDELLDYVEGDAGMGADFGCVLRARRELAVEAEPKAIRELLAGFSSAKDFVDAAVASAPADVRARCAVVAYACDYSRIQFIAKPGRRLRFLCVADC